MTSRAGGRTLAGGLLLDARRRAGLTQEALARRAGVARPLVSQYETGKKDPSLSTLARLIGCCGMELRISADVPTTADRTQYSLDDRVGKNRGRRNADRAQREVLSLRRPTPAELARLR
jgi:uncharacterized protein